MCEYCQPEQCGNCGSELTPCPECLFDVCPSEPEHIEHFRKERLKEEKND